MCKTQQHIEAKAESWTPQAPLLTCCHSSSCTFPRQILPVPSPFTHPLSLNHVKFRSSLRIQKSGNGNQVAVIT